MAIPAALYREIFTAIILEAIRHGNTQQIAYRAAWLGRVIQSHFAMHGGEIYEEAKSIRNLVDIRSGFLGQKRLASALAKRIRVGETECVHELNTAKHGNEPAA